MKKIFTVITLSLLILGCAGSGFKWDQARHVREGMTEGDLTAVMGKPYSVWTTWDGQQLWQWVYVDPYGVAGGTRTLSVTTKNGVVVTTPVIPASFR